MGELGNVRCVFSRRGYSSFLLLVRFTGRLFVVVLALAKAAANSSGDLFERSGVISSRGDAVRITRTARGRDVLVLVNHCNEDQRRSTRSRHGAYAT